MAINKAKVIFHIDLNMFFCQIAQIKNPALKGKAFAIGRENTTKGVLSTASYEARKYGIHSAMSIAEALRIKPDLIIINADFKMIKEYHYLFVNLIKKYSNLVEVASVDEVYADMTEISKERNAIEVAKEIQQRLLDEYNLSASIGIAPTLFFAKMASDMKKPLGLVVIRKRDAKEKLSPLPVSDIFGIGKKTWPKLENNGIITIGDCYKDENKDKIISAVGQNTYDYIISHITGNSSNVVMENRYAKNESISESVTFDNHLTNIEDILLKLRELTRNVVSRIIKHKYMAKTVGITLRNSAFKTITRSKTIKYTNDFYDIYSIVTDLVEENYIEGTTIRLVGVTLSNLEEESVVLKEEYNLFTYEMYIERDRQIKELLKDINNKFGQDTIKIGVKKSDE